MAVILSIVFAVMAVMNGALFCVLRTASAAARKQVESCFVRELEKYNDFLLEKVRESSQVRQRKERLQKEIEELEGVASSLKTSPFYAPCLASRELFIPMARYIDDEFFDHHRMVKNLMKSMNWQEIIKKIQSQYVFCGIREDYDAACGLLEFLNMETLYEFCTLTPAVQLENLQTAVQGTEKGLLDRFLLTVPEGEVFDILRFQTFVREIRTENDPVMYLRTGEEEMEPLESEVEIKHQFDKNISEGLKIIYQNRLYDFSIYRLRSRR